MARSSPATSPPAEASAKAGHYPLVTEFVSPLDCTVTSLLGGAPPLPLRNDAMPRTPNLLRLLADPPGRADRRSIGRSNAVAALVLKHPHSRNFGTAQLVRALWHSDPVVRMRAADALEKASTSKPAIISRFKSELLGLLSETSQQELRWHLALMLPRLPLTPGERRRSVPHLRRYLDDRSSIVKTCALQAIFELSKQDSSLRSEALDLLRAAARSGTAAMRARSRILLKKLEGGL